MCYLDVLTFDDRVDVAAALATNEFVIETLPEVLDPAFYLRLFLRK